MLNKVSSLIITAWNLTAHHNYNMLANDDLLQAGSALFYHADISTV